ncbi:EB domain-containing protein [Candidatus Nitrosotenuis chungbukensis]|uniref:EB domain-containing protein n=1 Tax=Candidatus Nitrosotenuis chungbukensis TaxID=1353246 RepID=UPI0005B2CD71|nr:EB domain-containing protein [Candidatus Nitrosotenuis chungbukensis]WKT58794.1 EB domain-containing protein [Candidatus Nitrosotenuis chungbukensis]
MRVSGVLCTIVLSLIVVSSAFSSNAFGQLVDGTIPPLSVKTELPLYDEGDSVVFSGLIKNPDVNNAIDITVRVLGPLINGTSNKIVTVDQIHPVGGSFEGAFVVSGQLWKAAGDYKILVNYGPQKAETTFYYNGGSGSGIVDVPKPKPTTCPEGQAVVNGQCVKVTAPPPEKPTCGTGTVYDEVSKTCIVAPPVTCPPGQMMSGGQCIDQPPEEKPPVCGAGTHAENGICVPDKTGGEKSGCLIATAAFGSELAPQVQLLREIRDNVLFSTSSGTSFMSGFNSLYYSFSPTVADWERENPVFKEVVKITITPMLSTLSILNHVNIDSESEMLGYGIGIILLNIGMYFVAPAIVIVKINGLRKKKAL